MTKHQPFRYRDRIKTETDAEAYMCRRPSRERAERTMVDRALRMIPRNASLLDAPCGNGRMALLAAQRGCHVTAVDLSEHVLIRASTAFRHSGLEGHFDLADVKALPYGDLTFDVVLCFRFFHHLPSEDLRQKVVSELCRVSKSFVLISYLNAWSLTSIKRRVRRRFGGNSSRQHLITLNALKPYFEEAGFRFVNDIPQWRYVRSLHLACFSRNQPDRRGGHAKSD